MGKLLLIPALIMSVAFSLSIHLAGNKNPIQESAQQINQYKLLNAVGCAPDFGERFADTNGSIPLLPGWGRHTMQISTTDDSVFLYFNQGMNMFFGFHFIEARASFKKAQHFDSTCAMTYLGEALTYGPNINNSAYKLRSYTLALLEKAREFAPASTEVEKALIQAQLNRYNLDTSDGFQKVNEAYVETMKQVYQRFSSNSDVGALYADALMQMHPWDLYDNVGNPKPWTPDIEGAITMLLKRFPDHPGINHYYIHCVEASNTANRGLESARKLPKLAPGLSHMLHMSSHIYIRAGFYSAGVAANQKAIDAYEQYKKAFPDVKKYVSLYYTHNLSMGFANSLFLPNYKTAISIAYLKRRSVNEPLQDQNSNLSNSEQYSYSLPDLAWVRYGKWDSILADANVPERLVYARLLQAFAKGMAYAKTGRLAQASKELEAMEKGLGDPSLELHGQFENAPAKSIKVAMLIVRGIIAEKQGEYNNTISLLKDAVSAEDSMTYNEPKDWLLPARHYLGTVLLSAKQFKKAESVFKEDLKLNPKNVWALTGLYHALTKEYKTQESAVIRTRLQKALQGSDVKIDSASF